MCARYAGNCADPDPALTRLFVFPVLRSDVPIEITKTASSNAYHLVSVGNPKDGSDVAGRLQVGTVEPGSSHFALRRPYSAH